MSVMFYLQNNQKSSGLLMKNSQIWSNFKANDQNTGISRNLKVFSDTYTAIRRHNCKAHVKYKIEYV